MLEDLFHGFYSVSLLLQKVQHSIVSGQVSGADYEKGRGFCHDSRHLFNPCLVAVIQHGFHLTGQRVALIAVALFHQLQHGVQVLLFISGNQAFALVDTFLNVADGAVEEACLALQRLAVEQNVYL